MPAERDTPAKEARPARYAPAAESVNPVVHQLLAERDTARRNGEDKAVDAATAKLNKLGYE